jgi:flagellar protein FlbD
MIQLHRLGHEAQPFHLNSDLIVTIEATPDTVITLSTGTKIVVLESPETVAELIRSGRAQILLEVMRTRQIQRDLAGRVSTRHASQAVLTAVEQASELLPLI